MIVYVLEFGNQRIEFPTIELANQYKIDNDIDTIPFEFEKVIEDEVESLEQKIEELNQLQFQELLRTDWAYIRERELGVEIPIEIVNERKAIREKFHNLKQQLK